MNPQNRAADRIFIAASLAGAITFGACVYCFLEGNKVHRIESPEDSAHLPADDSENADDSPDPAGDE